ncbi:reverse transcriptase domain-containing protein [Sphingopyxis sp. MSC1_008]|jgi:RNA-directed DNA polymerase|uniref:reverse transcriptase domain-containing protein n=1 Tax=Sphingopyxis sp. MSC1_008 TaxID=2909265 RepID=UPI0020BF3727|nr:reverse transcriptase domain-containing protein [Sphingopyxis sp. MSC1_008]
MTNALDNAFSRASLEIVWRYEGRRLRKSCFGIDRKSGKKFQENIVSEFHQIRKRIRGNFKPKGLLAIAKPKNAGGNRIICVPTVADRIVQFAILNEIRPALERRGLLNSISYGLIRNSNRTVGDARVQSIRFRNEHKWVYKADIEKFFDNIPRDIIVERSSKIIPQRSLHKLIIPFVHTEIEDGFDPGWKKIIEKSGICSGKGVRQGMPLSPYFAGLILRDLDKTLEKHGYRAIRYVDDIIAFFDSEEECSAFDKFLRAELDKLSLSIGIIGAKNSKTKVYKPEEAAEFLGMEIALSQSGNYELRISDKCLQNIGAKIAGLGSVDALLQKRVTLPKLGSFLDALSSGYLQAYKGAANHSELVHEVSTMKRAALVSAIEEALGRHFTDLDKRQRRFLGIE